MVVKFTFLSLTSDIEKQVNETLSDYRDDMKHDFKRVRPFTVLVPFGGPVPVLLHPFSRGAAGL